MSGVIIFWSVTGAQIMLALAMAIACWRLLRGPRAQDRVVAVDSLYVSAALLLVTIGIRTASLFYFEAALVIGLLSFVATVALAKFVMRGEVIE
ncbi:K+/H+ antiporter subunit F [Devosia sp.]|uniref:K+/H+ antiporter subunit F n=1 Tax=Devosia sp. TaxID=1871048 RepID=UPI0027345E86|nr:K+/H+ antiporter subunit F [Devosia sp.]MDP2780716.1 K+/H+ antiporter subunit F [Devosia sp.]